MELLSVHAVLFIAAAAVAAAMPLPLVARKALLLIANAAFLWTFHPLAPVVFLATSLLGFVAARLGAAGASPAVFALGAAPLLVPLFLPKLGWLWSAAGGSEVANAVGSRAAMFIGASYFTLRALSFAFDARRRGQLTFGLFDYLTWNSFFPTIVSGPIERADHFDETFARLGRPSADDLVQAVVRIFIGLFKYRVLGSIARAWADPVFQFASGHGAPPTAQAWIAIYAWLLYTWCDFAGYSDMAIGVARLFGIRLAENFDNPFWKPSISDFWRGWHLSLSFWIRDYLFVPLAGRSASPWRPHAAALASMTLCGLWHQPNAGWALWGLTHGVGLSVHQAWTTRLRKNFALKKKLAKSLGWRLLGIFLTFNFVAFSWTLVIDPLHPTTAVRWWKVLLGLA